MKPGSKDTYQRALRRGRPAAGRVPPARDRPGDRRRAAPDHPVRAGRRRARPAGHPGRPRARRGRRRSRRTPSQPPPRTDRELAGKPESGSGLQEGMDVVSDHADRRERAAGSRDAWSGCGLGGDADQHLRGVALQRRRLHLGDGLGPSPSSIRRTTGSSTAATADPSVNLVILSFVNPLRLLNGSADGDGVPLGMTTGDRQVLHESRDPGHALDRWHHLHGGLEHGPRPERRRCSGSGRPRSRTRLGVGVEIDYEQNNGPESRRACRRSSTPTAPSIRTTRPATTRPRA